MTSEEFPETSKRDEYFCARFRIFAVLATLILLVAAPLGWHASENPEIGPYSRAYFTFLAALVGIGLTTAGTIAFAVRRCTHPTVVGLAVLGILTLPVLAAEWALGATMPDPFSFHGSWGHVRSPLVGYETARNHRWNRAGATYTTDGDTFRTHLADRPNRSDEVLIVTLGGSSVFGFGLNDHETWPHLLEEELRARVGPHITVLNAGCNGHNSLQQLIRFYTRVLPRNPSVVIQYGAINDVRAHQPVDELIPMAESLVEARTARDMLRFHHRGRGFYQERSFLLDRLGAVYRSGLTGRFGESRIPGRADCDEATEAAFSQAEEWYRRNVETTAMLCDRSGALFVPIAFLADRNQLPQEHQVGLGVLIRTLHDLSTRLGLPLIDLQPELDRKGEIESLFFRDHYHLNSRGARWLAHRIARRIAPTVRAIVRNRQDPPCPPPDLESPKHRMWSDGT